MFGDNQEDARVPTICLTMIVKNESRVILRLLESLDGFIDDYCICDTGSTDDTIFKIKTYFDERRVVGSIIKAPFVDFSYNRNIALNYANDNSRSDYLLLMDADMVMLYPSPSIGETGIFAEKKRIKRELVSSGGEMFNIIQGNSNMNYKNTRIVKNIKDAFSYWGTTHEYLNINSNISDITIAQIITIDKSVLFINDIGDGGCKDNKADRDIELLSNGLADNPNNGRYLFYLANTYKDCGKYEDAIQYYKKRIAVGGWNEETWYCHYNIGNCYREMKNCESAVYSWLEAHNHSPHRCESLYEAIKHYRIIGNHKIAYNLFVMADNERKQIKSYDLLFLQKDVYDYKLDYELSIIGYYYNPRSYNIVDVVTKILSCENVSDSIYTNILSNYKFYADIISEFKITDSAVATPANLALLNGIGEELVEKTGKKRLFNKSTPSIYSVSETEMYVCIRYVNHYIDVNGNYYVKDNDTEPISIVNDNGNYRVKKNILESINVIAVIDISFPVWKISTEFILGYDDIPDPPQILGLEDIRMLLTTDKFSKTTNVLYTATRGLAKEHICVEYGSIYADKTRGARRLIGKTQIEKNWVLFQCATTDSIKCVYSWYPLAIGDIVDDTYAETHTIQTSPFFKRMRGSTNGVLINGELWFITHVVSYEPMRKYYHCFVVLDLYTYKVNRHTPLFKFGLDEIEYTLGFKFFGKTNELLLGYSRMDRKCEFMSISKTTVDGMFVKM